MFSLDIAKINELLLLSVTELVKLLHDGKIKATSLVEACVEAIDASDLNSVVVKDFDRALESAFRADQKLKIGDGGKLEGIPFLSKSILCVKGLETNACSNILRGFVPQYSATVIKRLQDEGAIVVGQTNTDEFAMGSSNENSCYGPSINPWKKNDSPAHLIAGGSSGGSASAVASYLAPFALGSDTGGSIRQPASLCGIVGMRPTYGFCSRWGVIPLANSLDQVGALTRSVEDNAYVMSIIAAHDPKDISSLEYAKINMCNSEGFDIFKNIRVGIIKEDIYQYCEDQVVEEFDLFLDKFFSITGFEFKEISIPNANLALETYFAICCSEVYSNLARYNGIRYGNLFDSQKKKFDSFENYCSYIRSSGFGREAKRRIMLGSHALSTVDSDGLSIYEKSLRMLSLIQDDFTKAWDQVDIIISPMSPNCAYELGSDLDPMKVYYNDILAIPSSNAKMPSISIPVSISKKCGLPIGAHIIAPHGKDSFLLNVANAIEKTITKFNIKNYAKCG